MVKVFGDFIKKISTTVLLALLNLQAFTQENLISETENIPLQSFQALVGGKELLIRKKLYKFNFDVSLIGKSWDYKEYSQRRSGLAMRDHGGLFGAKFSMRGIFGKGSSFLKGNLEFGTGLTQYDGGVVELDTGRYFPLSHQTSNTQIILEGFWGHILAPSVAKEISLAPYLGISIKDHFNPPDKYISVSYQRIITQIFIPVGLEFKKGLSVRTLMGLDLRYSRLLAGVVQSKLSQAHPSLKDHTNAQTSGQAWHIGGEFAFNASSWGLALRPFYRFTNIAVSEKSTDYINDLAVNEPRNKTQEIGLETAIRF